MKIPSRLSRGAIAVAAVATLTAPLSGTSSAAAGGHAPDSGAVPAPYPGAGALLPAPPSAPVRSSGPDACQPIAAGDYAHLSFGDASAHGWWYRGNCINTLATVYVYLQEYYSDGSWRTKARGSAFVYPGGGSGNRANARRRCENPFVAGWRSLVIVQIGNGDSTYTPGRNLPCQVLT